MCLRQRVATHRLLMLVGLALLPLLLQLRWLLLQAPEAVLQHWRDEPRQPAIRGLLQLRWQAAEDMQSAQRHCHMHCLHLHLHQHATRCSISGGIPASSNHASCSWAQLGPGRMVGLMGSP